MGAEASGHMERAEEAGGTEVSSLGPALTGTSSGGPQVDEGVVSRAQKGTLTMCFINQQPLSFFVLFYGEGNSKGWRRKAGPIW